MTISVSPNKFTLGKHKSQTLTITINGQDMAVGDQAFGNIKL